MSEEEKAFSKSIIDRDKKCIVCGEARREYLRPYHVVESETAKHDARNSVTLCVGSLSRWVHGFGKNNHSCVALAKEHREWFLSRAIRYTISLGYFGSAAEYVRWAVGIRGEREKAKAS